MPILHSLIGTVSKTDRRRIVECGCGWRYTSSMEDDEGKRDCTERHAEHERTSDDHAVWREKQGLEVREALDRLSTAIASKRPS